MKAITTPGTCVRCEHAMASGQFKRTGAFIGTVATGIAVAKIVSPRSSTRVIAETLADLVHMLKCECGTDDE